MIKSRGEGCSGIWVDAAGEEGKAGVSTEAVEEEVDGPVGDEVVDGQGVSDGGDCAVKVLVDIGLGADGDAGDFESLHGRFELEVRVLVEALTKLRRRIVQ